MFARNQLFSLIRTKIEGEGRGRRKAKGERIKESANNQANERARERKREKERERERKEGRRPKGRRQKANHTCSPFLFLYPPFTSCLFACFPLLSVCLLSFSGSTAPGFCFLQIPLSFLSSVACVYSPKCTYP
ncbi:MAG: hypothetical protein JOS17DRAFT_595240 [Linnemannia elongata]|nr:MAG: hypothetical protein JOS17DRAFT_595240 [Linnemannia elongata]